jgi:hypothetical protein
VLAALIGGIWLALSQGAATPAAPTQPTPTKLAIAKAIDFDPRADGGSAQESPKEAKLAIDGDRETAWRTERYRKRADFGGLKPGVGLVLDLGETREVREVKITVKGCPPSRPPPRRWIPSSSGAGWPVWMPARAASPSPSTPSRPGTSSSI